MVPYYGFWFARMLVWVCGIFSVCGGWGAGRLGVGLGLGAGRRQVCLWVVILGGFGVMQWWVLGWF